MSTIRKQLWRRFLTWALRLAAVATVVLAIAMVVALRPYYEQAQTFDLEVIADQPKLAYNTLPQHLIDAVVAAEDSRFFTHHGLDLRGVARAAHVNWQANSTLQGGSTITQQLAKQTYNIHQRTLKRKLVEVFLARRIENRFTKRTILSAYLSLIYYGNGFNGIRPAAKGYYQKGVSELTVTESATLVGLIKAPSRAEPYDHPARAKKARNLVLKRMADENKLSEEEAAHLQAMPLSPGRGEQI